MTLREKKGFTLHHVQKGSAIRRLPLVALAFVIMTFGVSATASATQNRVHITSVTPTVLPGAVLTIRVSDAIHTSNCSVSLRGPSSTVHRLPKRRSTTGKLQWQYRMPVNSPVGKWSAAILCGSSGNSSATFSVANPIPPANVIESSDGFTQGSDIGSDNFVSYGIVLQNTSTVGDALGVTVTVRFLNSLGQALTDDQVTTLSGIPASSNFYLGGFASLNVPLTITSMQVLISVSSTQVHSLVLPPSSVSLQTDTSGNESAFGAVTDPYQTTISDYANIYVVYFGPQGNIVGGDSDGIGGSISPGESVAIPISDLYFFEPPSGSTAQSSVDPCGESSCPSGQ
jgi:hypothetical protein